MDEAIQKSYHKHKWVEILPSNPIQRLFVCRQCKARKSLTKQIDGTYYRHIERDLTQVP